MLDGHYPVVCDALIVNNVHVAPPTSIAANIKIPISTSPIAHRQTIKAAAKYLSHTVHRYNGLS
jgi:hypothetical protein